MAASQIGAALKARLAALVFSPAIPVAWGNINYVPTGSRFLVVQIARAPNQRMTIAKGTRQVGSLVVTVASVVGNGSGEGEGIADAIEAWFPVDLIMSMASGRLRITATASIRDGYENAGYWRTPVVIPFEVLTA